MVTVLSVLIGLRRVASAWCGDASRREGLRALFHDADDPAGRGACRCALCLLPEDSASTAPSTGFVIAHLVRGVAVLDHRDHQCAGRLRQVDRGCGGALRRKPAGGEAARHAAGDQPRPVLGGRSSPSSPPGTRWCWRSSWRARRCRPCPSKIWATLRQDLTPVIAAASTLLIARHHRPDAAGRRSCAKD